MKKIMLIICDGMGDLPDKKLGNKTPLEAANKPNMDRLCKEGVCGIMDVLGKGVRPNSDEAHLALFGYELEKDYPGRGPIEAAGIGIELEHGDVAIRSNAATVDDELRVIDRRAGRIEDCSEFVKKLDGTVIDGIKFIVKAGTGYRVSIVMRGKGLSDKISNSDVHYVSETEIVENWEGHKVNKIVPLDNSKEAKRTAEALQKFLEMAHEHFISHPFNKQLKKEGKMTVGYLLTRGPGYYKELKSFKEKHGLKAGCIAGAGLYKGLGRMAGMELINVKGATGLPNTDVTAKFRAAKENIEKYDFLYVHVKPTDIYGENGDGEGKRDFIGNRIDPALKELAGANAMIIITADHSTPWSHKDHSGDPVPVLIWNSNKKADNVAKFGEKECKKGALGRFDGKEFMKKVMELAR